MIVAFYSLHVCHMSFKTKKAFTLIEMLIVVVIIGILAAALIPRLQSVQGRARDTKRKADISQLGSALAIYKSDVGTYSALSWGGSQGLVDKLVNNGSYLTAMPTDSSQDSWAAGTATFSWVTNYAFNPLSRNGTANAAFILMARTETDGTSSNWVYSSSTASSGAINYTWDANRFETTICSRTTATSSDTNLVAAGNPCNALNTNSDLRYAYIQYYSFFIY